MRYSTKPPPPSIRAPAVEPLSVLIVDDDPEARAGLVAAVRHLGHTFRVARDGAEALALYEDERADVILSDWRMPGMDGVALCKAIRDLAESDTGSAPPPYTYFIFVTGMKERESFVQGMHAGADDYLTKPVNLDELEARFEAARRVVTLSRRFETRNAELRRDSERFFRAARLDPLTEISNRLRLEEDLEALESRATRYGHRYCAALCDVDNFKAYNDEFGHLAGDEVLRRVARVIRGELRRGDTFYRYGGEEFLAILPEQPLAEGVAVMNRVRSAVEGLHIPHGHMARQPWVTISVGVAEIGAESTGGTADWLGRADMALYAAKARGRNRVVTDEVPNAAGEATNGLEDGGSRSSRTRAPSD